MSASRSSRTTRRGSVLLLVLVVVSLLTFTMLAFGIGVSSVLLALSYGSRGVLNSRRERLMAFMPYAKPVMGVALLLVGLAIWFHIDRQIEGWLLDIMPIWLQDLSISV